MNVAHRRALVVAFDDVLADTASARRDALGEALLADGMTVPPLQLAEACDGQTFVMALRAARARAGADAGDHTAVALAAARADRAFAARFRRSTLLQPGAGAFVRAAAALVPLALVAWTARRDVALTLELAGLDATFSCVITADDAPDEAPTDVRWRLAAERLARRVPVSHTIALAGTGVAIDAARRAGLRPVAVGALASDEAFRADRWLVSLDGARAADVLALVARAEAR